MGFFKQMKDMRDVVHEAPEMVAMAQQMGANAQANAAAQQAAAEQAMASAQAAATMPTTAQAGAPGVGDFEPISGVSLELYAEISKSFAEVNYDQSKGPELAARKGVAAADWEAAMTGWNARMQTNPGVAKQFNSLYTGRA